MDINLDTTAILILAIAAILITLIGRYEVDHD